MEVQRETMHAWQISSWREWASIVQIMLLGVVEAVGGWKEQEWEVKGVSRLRLMEEILDWVIVQQNVGYLASKENQEEVNVLVSKTNLYRYLSIY